MKNSRRALVPIPEQEDIVPVEEEAADSPARAAADNTDPAATETAAEPEPVADATGAEVETAGLTGWVVQVGSFSRKNADSLNETLRAAGYPSYVVDEPVTAKDGSLLYRVRIGPEVLRSEALKLKAEIKKGNGPGWFCPELSVTPGSLFYACYFVINHQGQIMQLQGLTVEGVDIGILVVLFLSAVMGLLYGLLNVLFSITAWIMAVLVAR